MKTCTLSKISDLPFMKEKRGGIKKSLLIIQKEPVSMYNINIDLSSPAMKSYGLQWRRYNDLFAGFSNSNSRMEIIN